MNSQVVKPNSAQLRHVVQHHRAGRQGEFLGIPQEGLLALRQSLGFMQRAVEPRDDRVPLFRPQAFRVQNLTEPRSVMVYSVAALVQR